MKQATLDRSGVKPRNRGRILTLLLCLALILAIANAGCSWIFVKGPPSGDPGSIRPPVSCTSEGTWPKVDLVLSTLHIISATVWSIAEPGNALAIGHSVWALIHALSGYSGSKKVKKCKRVKMVIQPVPGGVPATPGVAPAPGPTPAPAPAPLVNQGTEGQACYGNGTCNKGLRCNKATRTCTRPIPAGAEGGGCYGNGTCNQELVCDQATNRCVRPIAEGDDGGPCYANGTCNQGLVCDQTTGRCVRPSSEGDEGGPCYGNNTCNSGLSCQGGICIR